MNKPPSRLWRWLKHDTSSTDWFIVSLTAVIAVTSYLQWKEIHAGGEDTHKLAEAAKAQAEKAETISNSMQQAVRQLTDSAGAAQKQAKAAQDGVSAIRAQMQQDQRPLLKIIPSFDVGKASRVGDPVEGTVSIQNIGKTPAIDVSVSWHLTMVPNVPGAMHFLYPRNKNWGTTTGAVYPNDPPDVERAFWIVDEWDGKGNAPERRFTQSEFDDAAAGRALFVLYGKANYTDGFGVSHWTQFCSWAPLAHVMYWAKDCTSYNRTDHNN